jgi:hypothetical protein
VALEVLAANGVDVFIQRDDGFTPTPVISRGILAYNRGRTGGQADGIVITPSHNPPATADSNTIHQTVAQPIPTSRIGFKIVPMSYWLRAMEGFAVLVSTPR